MAVLRARPYGNQRFLVDLGTGNTAGPEAAFCEVILPGISIDVIEYRTGSDKEDGVSKLPGLARYPDVTLRRGIIGSLDVYKLDQRSPQRLAQRTPHRDHPASLRGRHARSHLEAPPRLAR